MSEESAGEAGAPPAPGHPLVRLWKRRQAWFLVAFALLWAASPFLVRFPDLGSGQANDYFPTVGLVADESGWSTDVRDWLFVRSNEHRVFVATVIYRLNVALTDGDNRGLATWSLGMMLITALALISLLPQSLRSRPVPWTLATFVISAFAFTPVAAHNVALGFSGTMWLTANALSMAALALASRGEASRTYESHVGPVRAFVSEWRFPLALFLAIIASWTYSTGLMAWGALLVLLVLQRQAIRRLAAVLVLGGATALVSLAGYGRPSNHPDPNTGSDPGLLLDYVWTYLGALHVTDPEAALALGVVGCLLGVAVFGFMTPRLGRLQRRSLVWPWLAVALYGLSNAVATGVGRSGMGVEQAMASRYGTLAAFAWIGILVPPLLVVLTHPKVESRSGRRWSSWAVLAVLAIAVVVPSRTHGTRLLDRFVERATRHPVAHHALRHGIFDPQVFQVALTPATSQLWSVRGTLEAIGHIPFDRPADDFTASTKRVEQVGSLDNVGYLDSAVGIPGGWVRLRGWSLHATEPVAEIVFTDSERNVVGVGIYGTHRKDVAEVIGVGARFSGFLGYVRAAPSGAASGGATPGAAPRAWVRLEGSPIFYPLVAIEDFEAQWLDALSVAAAESAP